MTKPYVQMTLKFPTGTGKDRYRQAMECIENRDRGKYKTQAEYVTSAVIAFEDENGDFSETTAKLVRMVEELNRKVDRLINERKSG